MTIFIRLPYVFIHGIENEISDLLPNLEWFSLLLYIRPSQMSGQLLWRLTILKSKSLKRDLRIQFRVTKSTQTLVIKNPWKKKKKKKESWICYLLVLFSWAEGCFCWECLSFSTLKMREGAPPKDDSEMSCVVTASFRTPPLPLVTLTVFLSSPSSFWAGERNERPLWVGQKVMKSAVQQALPVSGQRYSALLGQWWQLLGSAGFPGVSG